MYEDWSELRVDLRFLQGTWPMEALLNGPLPTHICPTCRDTITRAPINNYAMISLIELHDTFGGDILSGGLA